MRAEIAKSQCRFPRSDGRQHLSKGWTAPEVARFVQLSSKAVRATAHRYKQGGLECALYEKQRPGAASLPSPSEKRRIIGMARKHPPAGHARWTVRLVAEEAVKRKLVPRAGRETIRVLLQSHDLTPWREKKGSADASEQPSRE